MRLELFHPPWSQDLVPDLHGAEKIIDGSWKEAAVEYAAEWTAQRSVGRRGPVGVQKYLNVTLDSAFQDAGWGTYASTFTRNRLWFRVTFRHQMSAGSNIVDALKAVARGEHDVAVIAAATRDFLDLISPADAPALTSYEKLRAEILDLDGVLKAPIFLAALRPSSHLAGTTLAVIRNPARRR